MTGGAEQPRHLLAGACSSALHTLERALSGSHCRERGSACRQTHHTPSGAAQQGHLQSQYRAVHCPSERKVQAAGPSQGVPILFNTGCIFSGTAVDSAPCLSPWDVGSHCWASCNLCSQFDSWLPWQACCLVQCCPNTSSIQ